MAVGSWCRRVGSGGAADRRRGGGLRVGGAGVGRRGGVAARRGGVAASRAGGMVLVGLRRPVWGLGLLGGLVGVGRLLVRSLVAVGLLVGSLVGVGLLVGLVGVVGVGLLVRDGLMIVVDIICHVYFRLRRPVGRGGVRVVLRVLARCVVPGRVLSIRLVLKLSRQFK